MSLIFYQQESGIKIEPGKKQRDWMDAFGDRHAYKCLPLNIANSFGWDILLPCDVDIEWNGGILLEDISITVHKKYNNLLVDSNFSRGIVTFNLRYTFKTPDNWQMLVTGPPNTIYDNFSPLTGIVETDWLLYPFTMNWQILKSGKVTLKEGDSICRIIPIQIKPVLEMQPEIKRMQDNLEVSNIETRFAKERAKDDKAHGFYMTGKCPAQTAPKEKHLTSIKMKIPIKSFKNINQEKLFMKENYISDDDCEYLISAWKNNKQVRDKHKSNDNFWINRSLGLKMLEKDHPVNKILQKYFNDNLQHDILSFFNDSNQLEYDNIHIMHWEKGQGMENHYDGRNLDLSSEHPMPWRKYTIICYLNDDFEGGLLTLPDKEIDIQPKKGLLIAFLGGYKVLHGVSEITKGNRYTALCWLK